MSDDINSLLTQPTLTVDETARILRLSRNATYEAIRQQEIHAVRLGRRLVVPTAAIRRLLEMDLVG